VRGVGSAAFVAGTLVAGQAADHYGFSAIIWLSATALMAIPLVAKFVPEFPARTPDASRHNEHPNHPWLMLFRQRVFGLVTLVGALVLGSHAMYDSFAVIRWREAGIRPAVTVANRRSSISSTSTARPPHVSPSRGTLHPLPRETQPGTPPGSGCAPLIAVLA
jgi:PPP family 3-phenylpropionic acid transporter